jgi:DNA-binding Xre family transcriptional regulator
MTTSELKKQYINVINFHYERELWAFRAEFPYKEGIEPFVDDLIQVAQHYKQGLGMKLYETYRPSIDSESLDYRIGKNIEDLRIQKGWTLNRLAKRIRMDSGYLLSIERGELLIRIWDLQQIARAFKVQLIDLLTF